MSSLACLLLHVFAEEVSDDDIPSPTSGACLPTNRKNCVLRALAKPTGRLISRRWDCSQSRRSDNETFAVAGEIYDQMRRATPLYDEKCLEPLQFR